MFKALLSKEFILVLRDKHALAALFIMPAIFILIMSLALKDTFNNERVLLKYAVVDLDQSLQSREIRRSLAANRGMQERSELIVDYDETQEILDENLHFVLTIPRVSPKTLCWRGLPATCYCSRWRPISDRRCWLYSSRKL